MPTEELVCIDEMGTAPSSPLRRVQAVVTNDADDNDSPLSSPPAVTSDHAHETIGKSSAPFKPDKAQCWSCFTTLRRDDETGNSVFFYTIHEHPLLNFIVCSVCADNVESVEKDALDIELCDEKIDANSPDENNISACSWCGLDEDDLEDPDPPLADGGSNALFLCDKCPRAFCTRCVVLSHGGGSSALRLARAAAQSEDEEWSCCNCEPTDFLTQLQESCKQIIATIPNSDEEAENDSEDVCISKLIDELHVAEDGLEEAQQNLEDVSMDRQREKIEAELIEKPDIGLDELEEAVEEELEGYRKKWDDHHNRCSDTITYLQEELESKNVDLSAFYFIREKEKGSDPNSNDTESHPEWKAAADAALDKHDIELGFSKGEFRGASGYETKNPNIYKLEPEDLDDTDLNEIEDINTMEGTISQMKANSQAHKETINHWGSKMGTTNLDIEMLEKKCVKFEKISLGERIDLDELENKCITESDDVAVEKYAKSTIHGDNGRVAKRAESLRSLKMEAMNKTARSNGLSAEYQPWMPSVVTQNPEAAVRPKKRAQLQNISTVKNTGEIMSSTPIALGLMIGTSGATFESSKVTLPVENSKDQISVCRPLASLLKEHQIDGVKFCWKNVCSKIMNPKGEGQSDTHGCILAHNMGLGKSFQVVCLLHTLLTHPSLTVPIPSKEECKGNRLVYRALLIAPVNTLANWENEFEKWIGKNSGRKAPSIRFYSWNSQDKGSTITEWYNNGGVLCCSSERYARACKLFLDDDKSDTATVAKTDPILCKALFKPGPDIVVLDEAHSMLKTSTTNVYKAMNGLDTKLRLALTGTPFQNSLSEYFNMATWVRPGCLGSENEFTQKYEKPIMDGMSADCTPQEAHRQEELSNELHAILALFVHRCGTEVLAKELPFFQEAVIHVRQSKMQMKLYREFRKYQREYNPGFFKQYHALRPVSNHPACLMFSEKEGSRSNSPMLEGSTTEDPMKDNELEESTTNSVLPADYRPQVAPERYAWICDICSTATFKTLDEAVDHESTCTGAPASDTALCMEVKNRVSPANPTEEWWASFAERARQSEMDIKSIANGGKIVVLLQLLAHCDNIGDKVVVFSQCLRTLNFIEEILQSPDWGGFNPYFKSGDGQKLGGWRKNMEYLRIDGSVDSKERGELISTFNSTEIQHCKLFLLSIKAGGLGINLVAANRVVLFDSHWNPTVDLQAVYRCYRYGQRKPVFCYRLLAEGSMEEKIYSRAIAKTSLSNLVVDQRNIERFFTRKEMDLLQQNDNWVQCDTCNKWRMLPPETPSECFDNLPDTWYCKNNTYDKERANCDAKERDAYWYAKYWESQSQQESQEDAVRLPLVSAQNHERVESFTKRDIVLQTLLSRSEGTSSSTSSEQQTKSLISKYYFSKDKGTDDFDPKSPKKKNPPEKNHTKTNCNLASASKKAKNDLEKEDRKPPAQTKPSHHSSKLKNDMDAEKLLPTERKQSAKNEAAVKSGTINIGLSKYTPIPRKSKSNEDTSEQRQKSRLLDKMSSPSSNNPEERKENSRRSLPHDSGTSNGTKGKKRKSYPIFKSSDNVKVEVESKPLSSTNKPAAKKTKETESIVDLTFDSDSD